MADQIEIKLVADANGVIKAVEQIGPVAEKAGNKLNKGINKANKKGKELNKTFKKFGSLVGGLAIGAAFGQAVRDLIKFESKIAEVNTLLPKTNRVTRETEEAIKSLSTAYGRDNTDLASAYYDVISAGSQDAAKSLALLEGATKASVVGVTDVKTATGAILSVMNAYGESNVSAGDAAEKLFAIVQQGRTTFPELATNIGDIVPIASQLGIGFDELGGVLAVSTRVSGNTAKSVTQLGAAFANILKPGGETQKVVEAINKELGTSLKFNAESLKKQGLEGFLKSVFKATSAYKNQQEILAQLFGSVRALRGILSITGENFDAVKKSIDAISSSTNALNDGMLVINETTEMKFNKGWQNAKIMLQGFAGTLIDVASPAIDILLGSLENMVAKQKEVSKSIKESDGAYQDFLGRGAVAPETFDPMSGVPFQMGQEGLDPTSALIDNMVGMGGEESEENPMMQFAVASEDMTKVAETATEAAAKVLDLNKALGGTDKDAKGTGDSVVKEVDRMGNALKNGLARTGSFAIQEFTKGMLKGELNFQSFVNGVVGMLGDLAIQMGEMAILSGITMEGIGNLTGTKAIIAGAALVALGTIMKSFAGGGGGSSSSSPSTSIASPTNDFGSDPTQIGPLADTGLEDEPGSIEKQQQVQLVVHGDVLDSEETGTRLLNILNEEFDSKGGRIAYA